MRQRNVRVMVAGALLLMMAAAFFFVMLGIAPQSNDPAELMRIVGSVSGGAGGLALAMIVFGAVGRKVAAA